MEGNARNPEDLLCALEQTRADTVLLAIGDEKTESDHHHVNNNKTPVRTASAQALALVLHLPQFKHVRVVVISRVGAGGTLRGLNLGLGRGTWRHAHLWQRRRILADHSGQEEALASLGSRVTIVRTTTMVSNHARAGQLVLFDDYDACPSNTTDRADLVSWIVREILTTRPVGRVVNVTGWNKR